LNEILSYFKELDAQTQMIALILLAISILLVLALIYTLTRKRSPNPPLQLEHKIRDLEEKNVILKKRLSRHPTTELERPTEPKTSLEQARTTINLLKVRVDALKTDLSNWKQRCVRAEEIIEEKVNELGAVYKTKMDYDQGVTTLFLSHVAGAKDIDTAFTSRKIPSFTMPQIGSGVIGVAILAYLYLNKKLTQQIMTLLATPRFQLYLALGLVASGTILYYWKYRKDK